MPIDLSLLPDGGVSWRVDSVPGAAALDLRALAALDARRAWASSAGPAEEGQAHVYRTVDGGASWTEQWSTREKGVFHDAIALRLPELTPSKTVARFPSYLQELLAFDGIAAVSEESLQSLHDYWDWLGVAERPLTKAIPLGITAPPPRFRMARTPKWMPSITPRRLRPMARLQCSGSPSGK